MKLSNNVTVTSNGMQAYKSTLSSVLDLFASGASYRHSSSAISQMVRDAYVQDPLATLRCLFYLRDIRGNGAGGQGERNVFRSGIRTYAELDHDRFVRSDIIRHIPTYGRWDDLFCLFGVSDLLDANIIRMIKNQLHADMVELQSKGAEAKISLLAKWMPSCNTSSAATRALARKIYKKLGMSEKAYRKMLVALRRHIDIVESRLSVRDYTFDYGSLPSCAALKYRKAFYANDGERYKKYVGDLRAAIVSGDRSVKVNVDTLYPYDIVSKFTRYSNPDSHESLQLDNMWRSLPNYFGEAAHANWLAVVDVSGSMMSPANPRPMDVAIALGLYIAEHNRGLFHGKMITFSESPSLVEVDDSWSLKQKVEYIENMPWGYNTNLESVFMLVLNAAVENSLPASEMPEALVIISDMQFDSCVSGANNVSVYHMIKMRYAAAGYKMPKLVFWNAALRGYGNVPITKHEHGAILVGGCYPGMFEQILTGNAPESFMYDVLNAERYAPIVLE